MERDPRKQPRPGDVLAIGARHREVIWVKFYRKDPICPGDIVYRTAPNRPRKVCWITTWERWAKQAEVVAKGSDD